MNRHSRRLSLAAALLVSLLVSVACQPPGFYDTTSVALPGQPGQIARSYSYQRNVIEDEEGNRTALETAHVVMYQSTSATGAPNLVTGTIIVPNEPWTLGGERPIVALAPGTQGLGDECAPSKTMPLGNFGEVAQVDTILSAGFAVALTDYEGLGTPEEHTYSVADSQAYALLDVARAARNLDAAGLSADGPVALWGYSQGGVGAARAAELEALYAPDLNIKAVAAGGVPADPFRQVEWVQEPLGRGFAGTAMMSVLGLAAAYPELAIGDALTEQGGALADEFKTLCALDAIFLGATSDLEAAINLDIIQSPAWVSRIGQQRLGTVGLRVPAFVYHGSLDTTVPIDQAYRLRGGWCANGTAVEYREFPGDHFFIGQAADPVVLPWLASYLTGDTTPSSDC